MNSFDADLCFTITFKHMSMRGLMIIMPNDETKSINNQDSRHSMIIPNQLGFANKKGLPIR